jgi:LacI family transcriptional regulator
VLPHQHLGHLSLRERFYGFLESRSLIAAFLSASSAYMRLGLGFSASSSPSDSPSVGIDDRTVARRTTEHLLDLGHRSIGFIRGRPEHGATEQRYLGFSDEMRARGVAVKSQWVQTGNFIFADGLACAERMLCGPSRPTAVFASNDDMAAAVICAARQRGLELPRQLSVVGFDDAPVATMVWPQLTTIRQLVREMARAATELIIRHSPRRRGWPQPIPRRQLNSS